MQAVNSERRTRLESIEISNLLSFSAQAPTLTLGNLNVIVGRNGSGKSNLIAAIDLMRKTVRDHQTGIRAVLDEGGGTLAWLHGRNPQASAKVDVVFSMAGGSIPLRHLFKFGIDAKRYALLDERVELRDPHPGHKEPVIYYRFRNGVPIISVAKAVGSEERTLARDTIDIEASILNQRRDPEQFPQLSKVASAYDGIRVYREWHFGRLAPLRSPQRTDMRTDRLEEDFSNLWMFLSKIQKNPKAKRLLLGGLRELYQGIDDFTIEIIEGGSVQVLLTEGDLVVPPARLSDGTLRYLCLLAILCDPEPPPLICIEEPELGLHPDALIGLAKHLRRASEGSQIIVTTHSEILVDEMSETPECVLVCEKDQGSTTIERLDPEKLAHWLKDYRLGELWARGHIGGNR
jgi:predicted ATPase